MSQYTGNSKLMKAKDDDLTVISGIGETRQSWFRDVFAVQTYADLAALSADEIALRLKQDRKVASVELIRTWISRAAQLAEQTGGQERWKVFATFVVEFENNDSGSYRTRVHHMETDQTQQWTNREPQQVGDWIGTQLGLKIERKVANQPQTISAINPQGIMPEINTLILETGLDALPSGEKPFSAKGRLNQLLAKVSALEAQKLSEKGDAELPAQRVAGTTPILETLPYVFPFTDDVQQLDDSQLTSFSAKEQPIYSEKLRKFLAMIKDLES